MNTSVTSDGTHRARLERLAAMVAELELRQSRQRCEKRLRAFVREAWPVIDPAPYVHGWHIDAICEHLEAVSDGLIRRLLINIPPRHCKSLLVSVLWPAWIWAKRREGSVLTGPQVKFLALSYSQSLSLDHARLMRKLLASEWYQARWPLKLADDMEAKENFGNEKGGVRLSGGIDGSVTGRGGDIKIIDDPHKVKEVESDIVREGVIKTYEDTLKNRVTDPRTSAEVIVMQRIAEDDLSGHVLGSDDRELVHLMLPAEYEPDRHCSTRIGWSDPRSEEGAILWPKMWGPEELSPFKSNSYQWAGQYQQSPVPRGGGIFKREWWKLYPPQGEQFDADGRPLKPLSFPPMNYIVASVDTAFTTKAENDWSALTVWGAWQDENESPRLMLMDAWRVRLEFHELVEKIIDTSRRRKVDRLLIEPKANGISVAQEIARLCSREEFGVSLLDPKGKDKVARAYAVQFLWENGVIYAPERKYADLVISEMASFPKGKHDDLVDTCTQAVKHLRDTGFGLTTEEAGNEMRDAMSYVGRREPIYDV